MVSHSRTRYFGGSAGSHAGGLELLLYRRRTEPKCLVPDSSFFPPYHQRLKPYIFSPAEVGKLLTAAAHLNRNPASPLRPELTRLAIVLLFTTGMRRGELLKLTLGDYDRQEATLHIRETKFYKSRLLPINGEIADEIERYLRVRARRRLPASADTPLMWNATRGGRAYTRDWHALAARQCQGRRFCSRSPFGVLESPSSWQPASIPVSTSRTCRISLRTAPSRSSPGPAT